MDQKFSFRKRQKQQKAEKIDELKDFIKDEQI